MLSFMDAINRFIKNPFLMQGRACRSEFWWGFLGIVIFSFIVEFLAMILVIVPVIGWLLLPILNLIVCIVSVLFFITVGTRRLHDTNKSAWWLLLTFIPFLGSIALIVLFALPGNENDNDYGSNPLNNLYLEE